MPDSKGPGVMIVGSGRTGLQTARLLSDRGHDTVIIERNPGRVRELVDQRVATVIEGDATNSDVLRQADLDQADVIVTMTDTMGTNFTVCILATEICPDVRTVMRSVYETTRGYTKLVDAVLYPEGVGAQVAANEILGSDMRTLADVTGSISC